MDQTVSLTDRVSDETVALICCIDGDDAGAEVVVGDEPRVIGTGDDAHLKLSDPKISRFHCEVRREGDRLLLRDLKSKNGTWHGRIRIRECVLTVGATFKVGDVTLEARSEKRRISQPVWSGDTCGELVGSSPQMHRVFALISKVAPTDAPVLIGGETGTGKELVAREIHRQSERADGPFVVVDAGAISQSLADIEIFGHEKGAFTGADRARAGAFERASGGTLFLDEIGDLALDLQPKLLRALESGTVQRIGASGRRSVDVRILAATHRPLREMVNDRAFREDLFYRLAVVEIALPALRERPSDILGLATSFVRDFAGDDESAVENVRSTVEKLAGHSWPGNVRELRSLVRRVVILGGTGLLEDAVSDELAGPAIRTDLSFSDAKKQWIEAFERAYLTRLLDESGGNVTAAAKRAGLNRSHLSVLVNRKRLRE